jgi:hypothetical protein
MFSVLTLAAKPFQMSITLATQPGGVAEIPISLYTLIKSTTVPELRVPSPRTEAERGLNGMNFSLHRFSSAFDMLTDS